VAPAGVRRLGRAVQVVGVGLGLLPLGIPIMVVLDDVAPWVARAAVVGLAAAAAALLVVGHGLRAGRRWGWWGGLVAAGAAEAFLVWRLIVVLTSGFGSPGFLLALIATVAAAIGYLARPAIRGRLLA